jgi:hypothetical protein
MSLLPSKKTFLFLSLIFFCLGTVPHAFAENAVLCHCFLDRSYNPADKFASDDYILATSFNSLLAKSFAIPKRQIVMIKMNEGVAQDELLVGLKISKLTGIDIRKFLRLRYENKTWTEILSGLSQQDGIKKDLILEGVRSGMPVAEAGARVAAEMIAEFYQIPPEDIKKFRMSGLDAKEMSLLFILAHAGEKKPEVLVAQYKEQGRSWSEIAYSLGLEPDAVGQLILSYPAQ